MTEQRRPIKAWQKGVCPQCKGETWSTPLVTKATGFGYLPTGKVVKTCQACSYERVGPGAK